LQNCLRSVYSNWQNDTACYQVGDSIDMCPEFESGLQAKVNAAKCYKDYLTIIEK
jgi:hypothetical protein